VDVRSGRLLWHSALPMLANRPAAPLGAGAIIQVVDPQRVCLDVGIGRSVDQPTGFGGQAVALIALAGSMA
jgi:hypothetical protein